MSSLTQFQKLTLVISSCFTGIATAWTSTTPYSVDLGWPKVGNQGFITQNGQRVSPDVDPAAFPCAMIPLPPSSSPRIDFPLTGGQFQYDYTNTSTKFDGRQFIVNAYLGQFSNDVKSDGSSWLGLTTLVFDDMNRTGHDCSDPVDVPYQVSTAMEFNLQLASHDAKKLVGVDVTLGLRIVLFNEDDNQEEIYQCSYLRLVADDAPITQSRGLCNAGPNDALPPPLIPSSPAGPKHPPPSMGPAAPLPHHAHGPSHGTTIGIAVGVSIGVAVLLLITGFWLLRRRKSKKSRGTMALGFWVAGQEKRDDSGHLKKRSIEDKKKRMEYSNIEADTTAKERHKVVASEQGKDGNDKVSVHSDGGRSSEAESMHSEPLPVYQRGEQQDLNMKKVIEK